MNLINFLLISIPRTYLKFHTSIILHLLTPKPRGPIKLKGLTLLRWSHWMKSDELAECEIKKSLISKGARIISRNASVLGKRPDARSFPSKQVAVRQSRARRWRYEIWTFTTDHISFYLCDEKETDLALFHFYGPLSQRYLHISAVTTNDEPTLPHSSEVWKVGHCKTKSQVTSHKIVYGEIRKGATFVFSKQKTFAPVRAWKSNQLRQLSIAVELSLPRGFKNVRLFDCSASGGGIELILACFG